MHRHLSSIRFGSAVVMTASLLTVAEAAAPVAQAAPPCTPYVLPGLPGGSSEIIAISPDGSFYGGDSLGADGHYHAVYWTHTGSDLSTGWSLHVLPSPITDDFVTDINVHGLMLATALNADQPGYLYDVNSGTVTVLPGLGGGFDYDRRLNDAGVVAGTSSDKNQISRAVTLTPPYAHANPEPVVGGSRSASGADSHYRLGNQATGINNNGQVVGASFNGGHFADTNVFARNHIWHDAVSPLIQPLEWQANGSPHRLDTNNGQGLAWAINDAGLAVGSVADAQTGTARPATWSNGTYTDMGAPADITFGNAYDVSNGGWAAGGYIESDNTTSRAFAWDSTDGFRTLDPPASYTNSWSHAASAVLQQVGGSADSGGSGAAVVWQC